MCFASLISFMIGLLRKSVFIFIAGKFLQELMTLFDFVKIDCSAWMSALRAIWIELFLL